MPPHVSSERTSFDSENEKRHASERGLEDGPEDHEELPPRTSLNSSHGAPLEISPSTLSQPPQLSIPDGGLTAWLQVLSGFLMFMSSFGLVNAFGVWQVHYSTILIPETSNSSISWIGSLEAFLLCSTTVFAGPLFDRGYGRVLVWGGSFTVVFGLMMTSLCRSYWQLMLAQGVCMGLGAGCLFIVSVAILPRYFTTKRAVAIGIAASGSSLGGVIYPIIFHRLEPSLGFPWATRVIAFIALGTLIAPCILIRPRTAHVTPVKRKIIDLTGFRELPFALFSLASFFGYIGLYIPFFYISEFSTSQAHLDNRLAFYMLPVLSAGSIAGRIIPSFVADFLGPLNVLGACAVVAGVLGFCFAAIDASTSSGAFILWALLYGAFSGAFVSLQPSTVVSITDDMGRVGGRVGMNTFCAALGLLIGNPIAGVLVGRGSWIGMQIFCGGTLMLAAVLVVSTRVARVGLTVGQKA